MNLKEMKVGQSLIVTADWYSQFNNVLKKIKAN